ncbi:MAG: NAD(P)-dependent alcohol dehydrogenase [Rhodocyclaceae bacterium]
MNTTVPVSMRAWVAKAYGGPDVLTLERVPVPKPGAKEVLIRVQATTVSAADRRIRAMDFPSGMRLAGRLAFGFDRPRRPVLGVELTGVVVAVGSRSTRFRIGDPVIALCGPRMGGHAEYVAVRERAAVIVRPAQMPIETAAALGFGGTAALDFLRRAGLRADERILVIGAAGTVGSALVQLAAAAGAHVTAVTSTHNLEKVRDLGANTVVDRNTDDVTRMDTTFDVVADAVGALCFRRALPLLAERGRYLAINGTLSDMIARARGGKRCIAGPAVERAADLTELSELCAKAQFTPLLDSVFAFDALPQAHARVDTGHKSGSVVVRL